MSVCHSCEAEVIFVPNATSLRPMILDAKPSKGVVLWDSLLDDLVREPGEGVRGIVSSVYTDHHATCPKAAAWKGRTRKDSP